LENRYIDYNEKSLLLWSKADLGAPGFEDARKRQVELKEE